MFVPDVVAFPDATRVFAPRVNLPVPVVIVFPFTDVGVIAPATIVSAGVAPPDDEPENPFAVAIDTAVTVPLPLLLNVVQSAEERKDFENGSAPRSCRDARVRS